MPLHAKIRPKTKAQKKAQDKCLFFVAILAFVVGGYNLIIYSQYGIFLQFGSPDHESPSICEQSGFLPCTTIEGKCTKTAKQCIIPEEKSDCKYIKHFEVMDLDEAKEMKAHFKKEPNKKKREKLIKVERYKYENYCSVEIVKFYHWLFNDCIIPIMVLESLLAVILYKLFQKEIDAFAHRMVYGNQ